MSLHLFCCTLLLVQLVAEGQWLPYRQLIVSHGCQYLWQLAYLNRLKTYSMTGNVSLAWNASIEYNTIMDYECEAKNSMQLTGYKSRIESLLPASYSLTVNTGFTIETFVWKYANPTNGTLIGSWGLNAQRWKVFWTNTGQLAFSRADGNGNGTVRTCQMQRGFTTSHWFHLAVRYSTSTGVQFLLNGNIQTAEGDCSFIDRIISTNALPVDAGHVPYNGSSVDNFAGKLADLAIYHTAVPTALLLQHYARGLLTTVGPCNGHGTCNPTTYACQCQPDYWGPNCTKRFYVTSVTPSYGSIYGGTLITITGSGFFDINRIGLHVRIGPTITDVDNFAGATAAYSTCTLENVTATQVICTTGDQRVRGAVNVSVVVYDGNRPVFSTCNFSSTIEECYFTPTLDMTPRVWSYPQWAIVGATLRFQGAGFMYDGFQLLVGNGSQCSLQWALPHNSTEFSCSLLADLQPGTYSMWLMMQPAGVAMPFDGPLYIHPQQLTLYPLYPGSGQNCPTGGQLVQIHTSTYSGVLNTSEIRIYEGACFQRRTADFYWLLDKVPADYWVAYGYDTCPPDLSSVTSGSYIPSAFTIQNVQVDWQESSRRMRRFVDHTGMQHCLAMELVDQ
eukprot:GGOE01020853.1.p1 GENE.GGOE01020853.1~~GGOE01020853.1.p1  ORF type:complete len:617 (+),score=145.08 GGOE01020853.1:34-1884(+)